MARENTLGIAHAHGFLELRNSMKNVVLLCALVSTSALPMLALAESNTTSPAATNATAVGRLDFTVVVPSVLFLRIGTGGAVGVAGAVIDGLTFTVPATNIGDSTVIAGTGGDLTNGAVTVRVFSNFGSNVTLNSGISGQLANVAGDTIPWSQIAVVATALSAATAGFTNAAITHPAFSATTGAGTATTLTAASRLVRQEGKWTFSYSNTAVVPAGTYGNTSARNGRVIYTAAQV